MSNLLINENWLMHNDTYRFNEIVNDICQLYRKVSLAPDEVKLLNSLRKDYKEIVYNGGKEDIHR